MVALLAALLVYLPIGYAAVLLERRETWYSASFVRFR